MDDRRFEKYFAANRELWNAYTPVNERSKVYDLAAFKRGKSSLNRIEIKELGDVNGKTLLHLQCHFGQDTLSWARMGARVTGVDFSKKAIELAKSLARELSIDARFIECNVYDLPGVLEEKFDVVFTSYGALCWLPDLGQWAKVIRHFLEKTGTFYLVEFHPLLSAFDDEGVLKYPYFATAEPMRYEVKKGCYSNPDAVFSAESYEWTHSLSDTINALLQAGLKIEFVHEFPFSVYGDRPFLKQREDGFWYHQNEDINVPLMFSIKARP
ncbi:class I SAM-dependent methyltransferase [candidate division WOR-3 bacterium]|nr:class I SAM-dependent methyltransferase [candidate division WOR-3 bacterium]